MTSNVAPAHPHATSVAVYPALFSCNCTSSNQHRALPDLFYFLIVSLIYVYSATVVECNREILAKLESGLLLKYTDNTFRNRIQRLQKSQKRNIYKVDHQEKYVLTCKVSENVCAMLQKYLVKLANRIDARTVAREA